MSMSCVTFSNPAAITINDAGVAAPYPSNITVSGVTNPVTKVTVSLTGFNHTFPSDVDMMVVGPGGQKFILVSDVIGGTDAVAINWTLDDAAADFEQSAAHAGVQLRPLEGRHGAGWVAGLPLGRTLATRRTR